MLVGNTVTHLSFALIWFSYWLFSSLWLLRLFLPNTFRKKNESFSFRLIFLLCSARAFKTYCSNTDCISSHEYLMLHVCAHIGVYSYVHRGMYMKAYMSVQMLTHTWTHVTRYAHKVDTSIYVYIHKPQCSNPDCLDKSFQHFLN